MRPPHLPGPLPQGPHLDQLPKLPGHDAPAPGGVAGKGEELARTCGGDAMKLAGELAGASTEIVDEARAAAAGMYGNAFVAELEAALGHPGKAIGKGKPARDPRTDHACALLREKLDVLKAKKAQAQTKLGDLNVSIDQLILECEAMLLDPALAVEAQHKAEDEAKAMGPWRILLVIVAVVIAIIAAVAAVFDSGASLALIIAAVALIIMATITVIQGLPVILAACGVELPSEIVALGQQTEQLGLTVAFAVAEAQVAGADKSLQVLGDEGGKAANAAGQVGSNVVGYYATTVADTVVIGSELTNDAGNAGQQVGQQVDAALADARASVQDKAAKLEALENKLRPDAAQVAKDVARAARACASDQSNITDAGVMLEIRDIEAMLIEAFEKARLANDAACEAMLTGILSAGASGIAPLLFLCVQAAQAEQQMDADQARSLAQASKDAADNAASSATSTIDNVVNEGEQDVGNVVDDGENAAKSLFG